MLAFSGAGDGGWCNSDMQRVSSPRRNGGMSAKTKAKQMQGLAMGLALILGITGMALSTFTVVHQEKDDSRE